MSCTDQQLSDLLETVAQTTDDSLDPDVRRALIDRKGDEVTQGLVDIIFDDEQRERFEDGDTMAPAHAMQIIADRSDDEAVTELVRILGDLPPATRLYNDIALRLSGQKGGARLDDSTIDALYEMFDDINNPEDASHMNAIVEVLFEQRGPSDRLTDTMTECALIHPEFIQMLLHDYERREDVLDQLYDRLDTETEAPPTVRSNDTTKRSLGGLFEHFDRDPPNWLDNPRRY